MATKLRGAHHNHTTAVSGMTTGSMGPPPYPVRRKSHDDYGPMLEAITRQFQSGGSHGRADLFSTDVSGEKLWQSYLNTMELKQEDKLAKGN